MDAAFDEGVEAAILHHGMTWCDSELGCTLPTVFVSDANYIAHVPPTEISRKLLPCLNEIGCKKMAKTSKGENLLWEERFKVTMPWLRPAFATSAHYLLCLSELK